MVLGGGGFLGWGVREDTANCWEGGRWVGDRKFRGRFGVVDGFDAVQGGVGGLVEARVRERLGLGFCQWIRQDDIVRER